MLIPELGFGGAERSFSNLSVELARNYNISILTFSKYTDIAYPLGGNVIDLDIQPGKNIIDKGSKFIDRIKQIRAIKKKLRIDLSISFLEGAHYVNILSRVHDKVVISIRGSQSHDENIKGLMGAVRKRLLIPWLFNKADHIVALNNGICRELRNDFAVKETVPVTCIYNFYDIGQHEKLASEPVEEEYLPLFDGPVLITHGRLAREKGFHMLIAVFAKALEKQPGLKLMIIGDGPYKEELYRVCRNNSLTYYTWENPINPNSAQVFFLGYKANPFKYLQRASVFLLTSSAEGFGNSIAEAMICGLPIISADCPSGPREILAPGTNPDEKLTDYFLAEYGVLMPLLRPEPETIRLWADFIAGFVTDEPMLAKYRRQSKVRVRDFSKETAMKDWHEIIDKLIQAKSA